MSHSIEEQRVFESQNEAFANAVEEKFGKPLDYGQRLQLAAVEWEAMKKKAADEAYYNKPLPPDEAEELKTIALIGMTKAQRQAKARNNENKAKAFRNRKAKRRRKSR